LALGQDPESGDLQRAGLEGPAPGAGGQDRREIAQRRFRSMPLEVLHGLLVLLRGIERLEGAEVAALAGLRVLLARIEAVPAGAQFTNHCRFSCNFRTRAITIRRGETRSDCIMTLFMTPGI